MNQIADNETLWLSAADFELNPGAHYMQSKYHPKLTEPLWQQKWEQTGIPQANQSPNKPSCYVQELFRYPTGDVHMGHVRNYLVGDVLMRFYRMRGFEVEHSFSWEWASSGQASTDHQRINRIRTKAQLTRMGIRLNWNHWDRAPGTPKARYLHENQRILLAMNDSGLRSIPSTPAQYTAGDQPGTVKNPINRLIKLGQVRNAAHFCHNHGYLTTLEVVDHESDQARCCHCQTLLQVRAKKMCAEKYNCVSPQEMFTHVGADSARLFCLSAAKPTKDVEWSESGVLSCYHFLRRVWSLYYQHRDFFPIFLKLADPIDESLLDPNKRSFHRQIHRTIKRVTRDLSRDCQTNTAIAALMELCNSVKVFDDLRSARDTLGQHETHKLLRLTLCTLARLLYPLVPHFAEEIWSNMGYHEMIGFAGWPTYQANLTQDEAFTLAVQVNGKLRSTIRISRDVNQQSLRQAALGDPKIQRFIQNKRLQKIIAVPGRVVNIVVD